MTELPGVAVLCRTARLWLWRLMHDTAGDQVEEAGRHDGADDLGDNDFWSSTKLVYTRRSVNVTPATLK
jgi:hypothetical protein